MSPATIIIAWLLSSLAFGGLYGVIMWRFNHRGRS